MWYIHTAGEDYVPVAAETVAFIPGGSKTVCLPVVLLEDDVLEGRESFPLVIDSVAPTPGVEIGNQNRANLNIIDDDGTTISLNSCLLSRV